MIYPNKKGLNRPKTISRHCPCKVKVSLIRKNLRKIPRDPCVTEYMARCYKTVDSLTSASQNSVANSINEQKCALYVYVGNNFASQRFMMINGDYSYFNRIVQPHPMFRSMYIFI